MLSIEQIESFYAGRFSQEVFDREPRGLYKPMAHILSIPGKRIRPVLLLMACDAFGGSIDAAVPAAHAMEIFHNFTLVHDDIMDAATLRRGIATVHRQFGLNSAILSGDALFVYAYRYLCAIAPACLPAVLDVFNRTGIEIMEGQQLDMEFEQRMDVTLAEYLHMIAYKTSVLMGCSLQIGAILGGASADDQARIYDFGLRLGLSFQIKDDWLDTYGESSKVGKKAGGDIIQNKKTFLLITLLNEIQEDDRRELIPLMNEKDEAKKVSAIKALYAKYKVGEQTLSKADSYYQSCLASVQSMSLPDAQKANLFAMAERIHRREF